MFWGLEVWWLSSLCCYSGDLEYSHSIFHMEYGAILFPFTECMTAQMFRVKWFQEKIGACIFLGFLPHNSINRNPLFLEGMSGFCPFPDFAAGWWELAGGCIKPTVAVYSVWCIKPTRGSVQCMVYKTHPGILTPHPLYPSNNCSALRHILTSTKYTKYYLIYCTEPYCINLNQTLMMMSLHAEL